MPVFDLRKDIPDVKHTLGKSFSGLTSGITTLDDFILGFGEGEMITIAGRPGMGKSSLARDILLHTGKPISHNGVGILCTLEMSGQQIIELLATNLSRIDYQKLKKDSITSEELNKFDTALEQLTTYNIILNDDSYVTPDSIRVLIKSIIEVEPVSCLIIDYLQLMSLRKKIENRQEEVAEISRELKAIAREFNIPVISFSQLNRNVEHRESMRPRMTDLRESGAMENDSTKVILIHRQSYYDKQLNPNAEDTGEAEFIICKNRGGAVGIVECAFISEYMSFMDKPNEF